VLFGSDPKSAVARAKFNAFSPSSPYSASADSYLICNIFQRLARRKAAPDAPFLPVGSAPWPECRLIWHIKIGVVAGLAMVKIIRIQPKDA